MKRLAILILAAVTFFAVGQVKAQQLAKPDSIVISVFVKDTLGNPALTPGLVADTFTITILSPAGDSILALSGPPATAGLNVDSLTLKTLGRVYHWSKKLDDIDGTPKAGLYEVTFCAKKNTPYLVSCQTRSFQLVDSTANEIIAMINEAVDSLKASATVSQVVMETQRRSATYGNLLENPSFEDTITAATYNFWTLYNVGGATALFSSLVSTYGSIGYYAARLYVNAANDTAYFRSRPIRTGNDAAYEYGVYFDQGSMSAGDSCTIGLVTNNTMTFIDSMNIGALAAGTTHWSRVTKRIWLPAAAYQLIIRNVGTGHIQVAYFDDVFFRGVDVWSYIQRDSLLAAIGHINVRQDSLFLMTGNRANTWTKAKKFANADTLFCGVYVGVTPDTLWARVYYHVGGTAGGAPDSTKIVLWP